jgi:hypothetical protein
MEEFIIKETTNWGMKAKLRQSYPFIDHAKVYAFKAKSQKGPAREEQTFIVSYMYVNSFTPAREEQFLEKVNRYGWTYYKSECIFKEHEAYRILVIDSEVDLQHVLALLENLNH